MQLEVKTILNRIQHFAGFVYREVRFGYSARGRLRIHVCLEPHRSSRGTCSACRKPAPGYDRLPQRSWLFVPLWGKQFWFDGLKVDAYEFIIKLDKKAEP